jgi:L-rhamnose isomerase
MNLIADILDRLSAIEAVKERLRETGSRVEQWATQVVILDRQVQDIDRRLVRIETLADAAGAGTGKGARRSPGAQ